MGASSSGLLDEAKINHIKGLVDNTFQSFSEFYRQQYSAAYFDHLHQEVEPKKEGRGLLLAHRPQHAPEEVLYQGSVKFSGWDEQGKKCRERYIVLRRDYKVEIHENMEVFNRGGAAKLILRPAGGSVVTTEEESRHLLEQSCAGILNGVKEDSSSVVSSPDVFAVYLHLPYTGHTCFLFQQEEERGHFLSALKTCIRHCNLDGWCELSYESQAYVRALALYRQSKGCYESWEILLGTEAQVMASQVMEEVLPWLQSQFQSKVKGKKTERIRQWLATVQATYTLVLEQLTARLDILKGECRQAASANQALIRSNLDQIMSSRCFLEEKVRACISEEAEKLCSESVSPYLSSILETLTENISAGIQGMQRTLHTQMDAAFTHTHGGTEETKKALSTLCSISLDPCYQQVEALTEKLQGLKQRFRLSSAQRLVHSAHLEMEQLLDSAVYTLQMFLQSSARLQPSQVPVKMERAKERVLKQLDYDSRVVQRRIYQEAMLEITQPALSRGMDSRWKSECQQFEQYIFSDYSSFILVQNVYDNVLRNILSKEIETVLRDAASKTTNNLFLDTTDMGISQYSLLGHSPPLSPALHARDSNAAADDGGKESVPQVKEGGGESTESKQSADIKKEDKESAPKVEEHKESAPLVEEGGKESTATMEEESKESADIKKEDKESAPVIKEDETSAPIVEENKESALVVEENKESAPVVEENKESALVVEENKESAPVVEENKESALVVEENKESAPVVEENKESALVVEENKESAPVVEENKESAPVVEEEDKESAPLVEEALVLPLTDPELHADPQPLLAPVIIVTQQFDESTTEEADPPAAAESAASDSDAVFTPEPLTVSESSSPVPSSPDPSASPLSLLQPTEVPAECAQSEKPAETSDLTPDLSAENQTSEDAPSPQPDSPMKISLGSLSEAIGCDTTATPVTQTVVRQNTDRAVYLTGEIKDNWEMERVKLEKLRKAAEAEEEEDDRAEEQREEQTGGGKEDEGRDEGGELLNDCCEILRINSTERNSNRREESEEKVDETTAEKREEEEEEKQDDAGKAEDEEVLPSCEESQEGGDGEPLLGSVAVIRDLVVEITEVEMVVGPCPPSS